MLKDNIKRCRAVANLTQKELAELSGVSYSTITKLENGLLENPSAGVIASLAIALKVNVEDFYDPIPIHQSPFTMIDDKRLQFFNRKGWDFETWNPVNSSLIDSDTIMRIRAFETLFYIQGFSLIIGNPNSSIIDNNTGVSYEVSETDLNQLINSTLDYLKFNLNSVLERSVISVQPSEEDTEEK